MLKKDNKQEVENALQLINEEVEKDLLNGGITEAKEKINKSLKSLVGIDMGTVDVFSFNSLEEIISRDMHYNSEKFIAFASLMRLSGIISKVENIEIAKTVYFEKAIEGYYKAYMEDDEIDPKYLEEAADVAMELTQYQFSLDMDLKIFKIYELANKFDKAEDTLFYMLRKTNNDGKIILEGMRFYNRLKEREMEELIEGNLPLEEIEDGISELERRLGV